MNIELSHPKIGLWYFWDNLKIYSIKVCLWYWQERLQLILLKGMCNFVCTYSMKTWCLKRHHDSQALEEPPKKKMKQKSFQSFIAFSLVWHCWPWRVFAGPMLPELAVCGIFTSVSAFLTVRVSCILLVFFTPLWLLLSQKKRKKASVLILWSLLYSSSSFDKSSTKCARISQPVW